MDTVGSVEASTEPAPIVNRFELTIIAEAIVIKAAPPQDEEGVE